MEGHAANKDPPRDEVLCLGLSSCAALLGGSASIRLGWQLLLLQLCRLAIAAVCLPCSLFLPRCDGKVEAEPAGCLGYGGTARPLIH